MAAQLSSSSFRLYILPVSIALFVIAVIGIFIVLYFQNLEPSSTMMIGGSSASSYVAPEVPIADEGTITIWSWNIAAKSLESLIPEFNKVYPNIKVHVVEIPYNEANDKFRLAITTGTGFPDVWDTEGPVTNEYIKAGALEDITEKAQKYTKDFVSYKWSEVMQNGRIYALPWDTAPVVLFYRRDLFREAGVDPNSIETWDDFIEAGRKITRDRDGDGDIDQYMTLMSRTADVQEMYQILLSQYGGSLFNAQGEPTINTEEGRKSIELMKKIMNARIVADIGWWSPEFFDAIKQGKLATIPQGAWFGGQIKEVAPDQAQKWGVLPLPAVAKGSVRSAVRGGSNLAVPSKSKNKEAAWAFIEFALANSEMQIEMYKNYGIFPALRAAYEDPVFDEPNAFYNNQQISRLFIKAQDEIPLTFFYGPYYVQTNAQLSKEIILVLNNKQTPQNALDQVQKQMKNNAFVK